MEKIELPDECKVILLAMSKTGSIMPNHMDDTDKWLEVLSLYEFVQGQKNEQHQYIRAELSQKGKVYLTLNPELKDPSFWDDKHAIVDHIFNILGLMNPFQ